MKISYIIIIRENVYDNSFYSTDDNAVNWVNNNGVSRSCNLR